MQLNRKRPRRISRALGLLTANLLAATGAMAGDAATDAPVDTAPSDVTNDLGMTRIDAAVLFYQEAGGRVKATEPVISSFRMSNSISFASPLAWLSFIF